MSQLKQEKGNNDYRLATILNCTNMKQRYKTGTTKHAYVGRRWDGITFAVGCTLADGWMNTSPIIEAFFIPSPLAKRWGEVILNCARYRAEHFRDIL